MVCGNATNENCNDDARDESDRNASHFPFFLGHGQLADRLIVDFFRVALKESGNGETMNDLVRAITF